MSRPVHLQEELAQSKHSVTAETKHGSVQGRRAANGAAVFLEVPYALPPKRFSDPVPLPPDFRYEPKEYILESRYAAQPTNDGQTAGIPFEDKVGLGAPSEDPLFVNIVAPASFPEQTGFPVKVYIHGGFLQFGSPHGLSSQAQYIAVERSEVWVNIGYRLSVFGFLACDEPRIDGNFGFKDQWLALEWIRDNIKAFGGNPDDVQLTGLSAGGHSVHQHLHHISRLPEGVKAPFQTAVLQSNAILTTPKTLTELRPQFHALCHALALDPASPSALATLRDPAQVPHATLTRLVETDALGAAHSTFRGAWEPAWLGPTDSDPMAWQRSGALARGLAAHGVTALAVGDLAEEWYLYAIAHPVASMADVVHNVERYYPADIARAMLDVHLRERGAGEGEGMSREELVRLMGDVLSEGQVHLPVRLFARDMIAAGFPVLRYEIRWTPEQLRPLGYVTHATDRALWALRLPSLKDDQATIAREWLSTFDKYMKRVQLSRNGLGLKTVLALTEEKEIREAEDANWDKYMKMRTTLPGEI